MLSLRLKASGILILTTLLFIVTACDTGGGVSEQDEFGSLTGTVTEAETDEPISGATVSVITEDDSLAATSADDGSYLVEEIPLGGHLVKARKEGYKLFKKDINITSNENGLQISLREGLKIEKISGDSQSGTAGEELGEPLRVKVKDENSEPVSGQLVNWSTSGDKALVSPSSAETNDEGVAKTTLTLEWYPEPEEKSITVTASTGEADISFTATSNPVEVASVTIKPQQKTIFNPGYTHDIRKVAKDKEGRKLKGREGQWSVSNGDIVSIESKNDSIIRLRGLNQGNTDIEVSANNKSSTAKIDSKKLGEVKPEGIRGSIVEKLIERIYNRVHNVNVNEPAIIFNNNKNDDYFESYWTSTLYISGISYRIYLSKNGPFKKDDFKRGKKELSGNAYVGKNVYAEGSRRNSLPKGEEEVLTIGVDYGNTNISDEIDESWLDTEKTINKDHEEVASWTGHSKPAVQFSYEKNIVVEDESVNCSFTPECVREIASERGVEVSNYDIVAVLDLDAENQSGGWCCEWGNGFFVSYVGWFFRETDFGNVEEVAESLASTMFHHEVGHAWGWEHEWVTGDSEELVNITNKLDVITHPALFGWTDEDGDGTRAIFDKDPYGLEN